MSYFPENQPLTVTALPAAASAAGSILYVTDALTPVLSSTVVGGGAIKVMVWSNGTAWKVLGI